MREETQLGNYALEVFDLPTLATCLEGNNCV